MNTRFRLAFLLFCILLFAGCSSYIQRIVLRSVGRINEPIDPPSRMVNTPVLSDAGLAVSWIGHATVLIQIQDKIFITDPLFTNAAGMVAKRYVLPGLDPALLPRVDFTLISHLHFDHFSYGSLDMLPKNGRLIIPLGVLKYTPNLGFREIDEMKPWDVIEEGGVRITAVPVQHFSGRYGFDNAWMGDRGYSGYVIEYGGYTIFFGGDTGYHPDLFKEIGRRFTIDLAILPIAPGSENGYGSRVHTNPRGALKIMEDVQARYMMPMHFNTMFYGYDLNPNRATDFLQATAAEMGVSERVIRLEVGEQRLLFAADPIKATGGE